MNLSPLVSVIIPIYNVEKYLEYCLDSVINQTYSNLEIICINDGSTDNSENIVKKYQQQDQRITLITKKNKGLSDTRNVGLDNSNGSYLFFLDSDDCIDQCCIERLIDIALSTSCQIVSCEFERFTHGYYHSKPTNQANNNLIDESYKVYMHGYYNSDLKIFLNIACAKLYERSLFESIRFPVGKINEDEYTTYKTYAKAKSACHYFFPLYGYRQRKNSIMHSPIPISSKIDLLHAYENRISVFAKFQNRELNALTTNDYLYQILSLFRTINPALKKQIIIIFRKGYKKYSDSLNKNLQIKYLFFYLFPNLFCLLADIADKFKVWFSSESDS